MLAFLEPSYEIPTPIESEYIEEKTENIKEEPADSSWAEDLGEAFGIGGSP